MKILITGGTGFIGRAIINSSFFDGSEFIVLSRTPEKFRQFAKKNVTFISSADEVSENKKIDAIINLAGENIASKRWSFKQKQELINSRLNATEEVLKIIKKLEQKPKILISASAIGYYGSWNDEEITEETEPKENFTSILCKKWEDTALRAYKSYGVRTCIIRLGVVLGWGGALEKMLLPFKACFGGKIGNGRQYFSWVHIYDVLSAIKSLIDNEACETGSYNLTSPNPVTNSEYTKALGKALKRPTLFPMPSLIVKLLFGEMGETLLLKGQKVLPKKLEEKGFDFKFAQIQPALNSILKGTL